MSFFVSRSVTFYSDDPWREDVILIDERGYVNSRVERFPVRLQSLFRRWFEFRFACYLLSLSAKNDSIAVGRYGLWVPILAKFLHLKRYIILTDIEWPKVKSGLLNRTAALASKALCCFTSEESKRYSRQYRIPENKFHLVHTPFDLTNLREPVDSEYIFTGGYQARDWDTLLRAVKDLPYPVKIFSREQLKNLSGNITLRHVNNADYYSAMARASCVVITLKPEPMRITGMITWATAMAMGKVVIVTEPFGASDYMEHGVSGFIVKYGDADALKYYINLVMSDQKLRKKIGNEAKSRSWQQSNPEVFRKKILTLLENKDKI